MKRFNYYNTDLKLEIAEYLDSKNKLQILKTYNINGDLSNIRMGRYFNFKGIYLFYCNKNSNLDKIDNRYPIFTEIMKEVYKKDLYY